MTAFNLRNKKRRKTKREYVHTESNDKFFLYVAFHAAWSAVINFFTDD
jgi:hypothetical protein